MLNQPPLGRRDSCRSAFEDAFAQYVSNYYPSGVSSVFYKDKALHLCVVGNKYNPDNFWSGRWRSHYTVQLDTMQLTGSIQVQVHYYEDGNVQLNTSKTTSAQLVKSEDAATVSADAVKHILKVEADFQNTVNNTFNDVSVSNFKTLRRALPVTRTRIDWNAIANCNYI